MQEVLDVVLLGDEGLGSPMLDEHTPAVLVDAVALYLSVRRTVRAHFDEAARTKHEEHLEHLRKNQRLKKPKRRLRKR